jgi:hypothetical protein
MNRTFVQYKITFSDYPLDFKHSILHELEWDILTINTLNLKCDKDGYPSHYDGEVIITYDINKNHKELTKHFCRTANDDMEITIKRI